MKHINTILVIIIMVLLSIYFMACNPVKQVLNDKNKLDAVAQEVVKRGYCANDTVYNVTSDTVVQDFVHTDTILDVRVYNDTTFVLKNIYKTNTKILTIHDTIRAVVVDNARVDLYKKDFESEKKKAEHYKDIAEKRLQWLVTLLFFLFLYIVFKIYLKTHKI